ncbi:MAG TPA: hypothetical protein VHD56_15200 [Tepidisphaeraceae bacterium]|nr:hypothetical protein [Tepidisphaeraceae bacterium]
MTTARNHNKGHASRNGGHHRHSELDSLKDSVSQLREDVMDVVENTVDAGKARASQAMSGVTSRITDMKDMGNDQLELIGKRIGERPLASAAIAVGIGFILAHLLGRK